jgi:hypothetical protein
LVVVVVVVVPGLPNLFRPTWLNCLLEWEVRVLLGNHTSRRLIHVGAVLVQVLGPVQEQVG